MDNATKIQAVINTLETMYIPNTYANTDKLYGIFRVLSEVRDDIAKPEKAGEAAENKEDAGKAAEDKKDAGKADTK